MRIRVFIVSLWHLIKAHAKRGTPAKRRNQFPAPKKRPPDTEWETENTCLGSVRKNKDVVRQIEVPKKMFTCHIVGQFHFGFILFL